MKRNVDLTEDRLFTTTPEPTGEDKVLFDYFRDLALKPWEFNFCNCLSDIDFDVIAPRSLIATGDKESRARWYRTEHSRNGEICERCGKSKGKLPWDKKSCDCYQMVRTQKIPWNFG